MSSETRKPPVNGELVKKGVQIQVAFPRLAVLIVNAMLALQEKSAEHEATDSTVEELFNDISRVSLCNITIKRLEELLYLANIRTEESGAKDGAFWSPEGQYTDFDDFLRKFFRYIRVRNTPLSFDKELNNISYKVKEATDE